MGESLHTPAGEGRAPLHITKHHTPGSLIRTEIGSLASWKPEAQDRGVRASCAPLLPASSKALLWDFGRSLIRNDFSSSVP